MLAGGLYAQSKQHATLIGFRYGVVSPVYLSSASVRNIKLGIPTFSYAASIERRFSLHNKLNFSFQYSLNYYKTGQIKTMPAEQAVQSRPTGISNEINLSVFYPINERKHLSVYSGVGVSQAVSTYFSDKMKPKSRNFGLNDVNPSLILGMENSIRLFNKNLYYSLQYNIGFFPFSRAISTENDRPALQQNLQFGLKYKY
jgi:hypothetical protein